MLCYNCKLELLNVSAGEGICCQPANLSSAPETDMVVENGISNSCPLTSIPMLQRTHAHTSLRYRITISFQKPFPH